MSDEELLKSKVGTGNPFKVPEGYFETFQQQLLSSLPERPSMDEEPARTRVWGRARRTWISVAAAFVGVVVLFATLHQMNVTKESATLATADEMAFTEDEMAEYMASSVFDDYTLYCYLTNEE